MSEDGELVVISSQEKKPNLLLEKLPFAGGIDMILVFELAILT